MMLQKLNKSNTKPRTIVSTSSSGLPEWKQSPVDLNKIYTWSKTFPPLRLNGHWHKGGLATMTNTGHTGKPMMMIFAEDAKDLYNFRLQYSMEAQAIHWNTRYESIEQCYEKSDGIAVLSYLLQFFTHSIILIRKVVGCPDTPDNPNLSDITNSLPKIRNPGTSTSIPSGNYPAT
ncbi:carbonic anhydrase 6-like [Venturia canescens]|uniref:carbonic anhydrase 6-like n=1 Tax=Venturia canescens TaxID=32260 RepID=UPI001C9C3460|nr:carbonic anhydrase 6-like [Venturia canescens]